MIKLIFVMGMIGEEHLGCDEHPECLFENCFAICSMKRKVAGNRKLYVVPFGSGWAVKEDCKANLKIITDRKSEAILFAKEISKNNTAALFIYGRGGTLKRRYLYG